MPEEPIFEHIETIEDVLPFANYDHGIVVSDHERYKVINYDFIVDDTFSKPMALECRGLKFAPDGRIIARPFHKFFNLGEREQIQEIDWSRSHTVLEKLDGSLIHPAMLEDELVFMTRMGKTFQADQAFAHSSQSEQDFCRALIAAGITPMFEFTSPDNRIVVAYDNPQLTLLAARHMNTGIYLAAGELRGVAEKYDVHLVEHHDPVIEPKSFLEAVRTRETGEGYVVAFENGHRLKIKADAYVLRHKALSGLAHEKNVLMWVLTDAVDDVLPLVAPAVADRIVEYQTAIRGVLKGHLEHIQAFCKQHDDLERKDFAQRVFQVLDKRLANIAFAIADGKDGQTALTDMFKRAAGSEKRIAAFRDFLPVVWDGSDIITLNGGG